MIWLICGVDAVHAQSVQVEWLKFEQNGRQYLVLNAFEVETDIPRRGALEFDYVFAARPAFHRLNGATIGAGRTDASRSVYPLIVDYPLRDVPDSPQVQAFLNVLEDAGEAAGPPSSWKPETLEEWSKLLRVLTTRQEIWLHGRVIRSIEVTDVLKDVYAVRGYPSTRDPVFPHLARGVLAVLDSEGRHLTSIDVDFNQGTSDAPVYRTVTFANIGSKPLHVYTERGVLSPIRLSGAPSVLYPAERTSSQLKLEQSVFAIAQEESKALLRYGSGGVVLDGFEVKAHHTGWFHGLAMLDGIALSHAAAAAAGLLITLLIIAVFRISAAIAVPRFAVHPLGGRSRRRERHVLVNPFTLHRDHKLGPDAIRSAAFRISGRVKRVFESLRNRFRSSAAPSLPEASAQEGARWQVVLMRGASDGAGSSIREDYSRPATSIGEGYSGTTSPGLAVRYGWISSMWEAASRRMVSAKEASDRRMASICETSSRHTALSIEGIGRMITFLQHEVGYAVRRRTAVFLRRLFQRAVIGSQRTLVRARRMGINFYLYRELVAEPIRPRHGTECVDRVRRLTHELQSKSTNSFSRAARRSLRKEAQHLARRLESDLAHELIPRTTTNFQVLWALRLLLAILKGPPEKVPTAVHRWFDGADRVLRNDACDGVGPTVPEFLDLVT